MGEDPVKHYFFLFKNKIPKLRYSINKSLLGVSGYYNYLGKVQVLYNNTPVENLYICHINLVNTSHKDFKDIQITVWSELDSMILVANAQKFETINPLRLTEQYIQEAQKITSANEKLIWSRRPYFIPVLNRDDNITFSCLVKNEKGKEPNIYLDCDHPGLKMEANFIQPQLFWGENQSISALWGLVISAVLVIPVLYSIQSKIIAAIIVFILGAFCLIPGVLFVKLMKKLQKIIR